MLKEELFSGKMSSLDKTGELYLAIKEQDCETVAKLLQNGVNVDEPHWSSGGTLALLEATSMANMEMVKLLIASGCDVNIRNGQGETALHLAIKSKNIHPEMINILLESNIDPNIQENLSGHTPLHILTKQFSPTRKEQYSHLIQTLSTMVTKCDVNTLSYRNSTPLHHAVTTCSYSTEPVMVLLEADAQPDYQNFKGETPLMVALEKDATPTATLLIQHGADLTLVNRYGETALHIAARKNCEEVVRLLVTGNCAVNAQDLSGNTALHLAAGKGYKNIVETIIHCNNINVNIANKEGLTALHLAVESGFTDVVQLLLLADACDVTAHTDLLQTPLDLAQQDYRRRSSPEISRMLVEAIKSRSRRTNTVSPTSTAV